MAPFQRQLHEDAVSDLGTMQEPCGFGQYGQTVVDRMRGREARETLAESAHQAATGDDRIDHRQETGVCFAPGDGIERGRTFGEQDIVDLPRDREAQLRGQRQRWFGIAKHAGFVPLGQRVADTGAQVFGRRSEQQAWLTST